MTRSPHPAARSSPAKLRPSALRPAVVRSATLGLTTVMAFAGCSTESPPTEPEATPHGYVEGAEETDSPQVRLLAVDADSGDAALFDPETEDATALDLPGGSVDGVVTDGRYAYVTGDDETTVIDTGVWTVDHGDHNHYYRTEPATLGTVPAEASPQALGDVTTTVLTSSAGIQVLDRDTLDDGEVAALPAPDTEALLPLGDRLLGVGGAEKEERAHLYGLDGTPTDDEVTGTCPNPGGSAMTRRGAVLTCSDATLIVDEDDLPAVTTLDNPTAFDGDSAPRLHHRDRTAVLATLAADANPWVLDVAEEEWLPLDGGPAASVLATGEETPVLTLSDDGHLSAYDPHDGDEIASTELIEPPTDDSPAPPLTADAQRAYVADPRAQRIHEVDYVDDLRVARTFDLDVRPDHLVQTGW